MKGFITNEGTAYAEGVRENGEEGKFVVDTDGEFVSADGVHLGMMFQFARESTDFVDWSESKVLENAKLLSQEHRVLTSLPMVKDESLPVLLRTKVAEKVEALLKLDEVKEKVMDRFRTAYQRSGADAPILDRDVWDYDKTRQLLDHLSANETSDLITTLRSEGVF